LPKAVTRCRTQNIAMAPMTLKKKSASGIAFLGRPISLTAPAKPSPCNSPNVKATTQGRRAASPGRPCAP
jgi:hypothetical protein